MWRFECSNSIGNRCRRLCGVLGLLPIQSMTSTYVLLLHMRAHKTTSAAPATHRLTHTPTHCHTATGTATGTGTATVTATATHALIHSHTHAKLHIAEYRAYTLARAQPRPTFTVPFLHSRAHASPPTLSRQASFRRACARCHYQACRVCVCAYTVSHITVQVQVYWARDLPTMRSATAA